MGGIIAYLRVGAGLFDQVKTSGLRLQLGAIDKALELEKLERNRYPRDIAAFLRNSFGGEDEHKDPAKDPWGNYYQFQLLPKGYELSSAGEDETAGTEDDVIWRREGEISGLVEKRKGGVSGPVVMGGEKEEEVDPLLERIESAWMLLEERPPETLVMDEAAMNSFLKTFLEQTYVE